MCSVSAIGDYYTDRWTHDVDWMETIDKIVRRTPTNPEVTREEFEELKKEVILMKELLMVAKAYDQRTGQPDCEMEEKVDLLKKVADAVGVDLAEVFSKG